MLWAGPWADRSPIRGRVAELETIDASLAALAEGRGGVVCIEGPPGAGKTRLLEHAVSAAEVVGIRAVSGGGDPDGQMVPLGPLLEALTAGARPLLTPAEVRAFAGSADQGFGCPSPCRRAWKRRLSMVRW